VYGIENTREFGFELQTAVLALFQRIRLTHSKESFILASGFWPPAPVFWLPGPNSMDSYA
jgi:hypothetical protein